MNNRTEELNVELDEKDQIEEDSKTRQNAEYVLTATTCFDIIKQYTGNTAPADHENNHTESERIVVPMCLERAVTEEIAVVQ